MQSSPFLGASAQFAKNRVFKNRSNEIFPGIKSDSPVYLKFAERLADELNERFPSRQDDEGISEAEAISGDFNGLRTVSGYMMTPRSLPTISNALLVKELGLAPGFVTPRHKAIFSTLHKTLYQQWTPSDVMVARMSSSTFPFFSKDVDYKVNHALHVMANFQDICEKLLAGKMSDVFNDHKVLIAHALNYRNQVDTIIKEGDKYKAKPRLVNDFEYALSGGTKGSRFAADKSIIVDNQVIDGHFAMRSRPVYGMSAPFNYAMSSVMSGYRQFYLKEFGFTFKHTTAEQIEAKVNKFDSFRGFDVSQFDETNQTWMLHEWMDLFQRDWPEWLTEAMKLMLHAPYYSPPPSNDGGDSVWMGNPFDKNSFKLELGLPSGIAPNPDIGKFMMTFAYLCFIDDHFGDLLEFGLDKVLKGEHPRYGLLDMSDDAVILTNSPGFKVHITNMLKEKGVISPYFKAAEEESVSFLGNVFYRPTTDYKGVKLAPDIRSFFLNWFCPERGVQDNMRKYWATGWFERGIPYGKAPGYSDATFILRNAFRSSFGVTPDGLAQDGLSSIEEPQVEAKTAVDHSVIMDPSKLFYRYTEKDVSKDVYDSFIAKIPADEVRLTIAKYFKG